MDPAKYEYQGEFARRYVAEGRAEGRTQGRVEGKVELVLKLLVRRFGPLPVVALAGIVVRNSIILIDFIEHIQARDPGRPLAEVIVEAGATRFRPILLTAGAAMFGSVVITLDPIFSGLAWSFIFGISASTMFTLIVVPLVYHRLHAPRT